MTANEATMTAEAYGDPLIAVETGDDARPWVMAQNPNYEPCGDCHGYGYFYEEGSAPDPAVGWLGEEPSEEQCPNCRGGWVRVGGEE